MKDDQIASVCERLPEDLLEHLRASSTFIDGPFGCVVKGIPAYKIQFMAGVLKFHLYPPAPRIDVVAKHATERVKTIAITLGVVALILVVLFAGTKF